MEFWIWLIIVVIMAITKGFEKLAEASRQSPAETEPPPPQPKPPRPKRPPHARQPQRQRVPPPVQPTAPPVTPPPPRAEPAPSLREFAEPSQTVAVAPTPPVAAVEPPRRSDRAKLWAGVLRDRQTLRSLVLAREILGPPRSLREYEQSGWQPG
ncbi:MAG: hypothetical protein NZ483_04555 [Verrucomicrobiae bacterium]|nr:hypothetical protein [Verrucomicrobiae bacterium]MDW8345131.1 hypothetical protein [Verrucomicrobiae bacterium]